MAAGDITFFDQFLEDEARGVHNLHTDEIRLGLITNVAPPAANDAGPHWGGTGTTNYATNQVGTGGTSYTGPFDITNTASQTGGTLTFDGADVTLAQDASGPNNIGWGILYNHTDANKRAIAFVQIRDTADHDLTAQELSIIWATQGIGSKTAA